MTLFHSQTQRHMIDNFQINWLYFFTVDICDDNPCENGGTCSAKDDGYECDCKQGFQGINCEEVIGKILLGFHQFSLTG